MLKIHGVYLGTIMAALALVLWISSYIVIRCAFSTSYYRSPPEKAMRPILLPSVIGDGMIRPIRILYQPLISIDSHISQEEVFLVMPISDLLHDVGL